MDDTTLPADFLIYISPTSTDIPALNYSYHPEQGKNYSSLKDLIPAEMFTPKRTPEEKK